MQWQLRRHGVQEGSQRGRSKLAQGCLPSDLVERRATQERSVLRVCILEALPELLQEHDHLFLTSRHGGCGGSSSELCESVKIQHVRVNLQAMHMVA